MNGAAPERHLGRWRLVAVGINAVIGGGIFILPASVTALVGPAALYAYLVAGAVVLGIGLALASLAARFDASGGPYLYVQRSFGDLPGFVVGWLFCLARLTAMANLMNGFALYLGALLPGGGGAALRALFVLVCATGVVGINIAGIRRTAAASNLLAVAKILPLVIVGGAGLLLLAPARFAAEPFAPVDFLRAVLLLIFAFTGFEIVSVPAEESLHPRRDIPFALLATIGTVGVIYLLVHTALLGMLPGLGRETAPLATAAGLLAGPAGRYGMTGLAALSIAGCTLISLVGASRLMYAMSASGQIPRPLGALGLRSRAPVTACLIMGGPAAALAITSRYEALAAVSTGSRLLVYLACCFACLRGGASGGVRARGLARIAVARLAPVLTAAAIVALLFGLEPREAVGGIIGVGAGLALYMAARRGQSTVRPQEESR